MVLVGDLLPVKIHVRKVTLVGHGSQAILVPNHLSSFEADNHSRIELIAVRGNLLARNIWQDNCCIQFFDWTKSTSSIHYRTTIVTGEQPVSRHHPALRSMRSRTHFPFFETALRLLPGNRLLACSPHSLMIYTFTIMEAMPTDVPRSVPEVTQPLWKLPFDSKATEVYGMSDGVSDKLVTYFTLNTNTRIYKLIVSPLDEAMRLFVLMTFDRPDFMGFFSGSKRHIFNICVASRRAWIFRGNVASKASRPTHPSAYSQKTSTSYLTGPARRSWTRKRGVSFNTRAIVYYFMIQLINQFAGVLLP